MIADWDTNTIYFSGLLETDPIYSEASNKIFSTLDNLGVKFRFLPNTKDIWARDYMPIQVEKGKFIEFRYDPDYLQGDSNEVKTRELKTYPDIVCDSIGLKTIKSDIILDGGNLVKSENSVILTDKIVWENRRSYSKKDLIHKLHNLLQVDKIVLISWDKGCEFGHADGMLRFISNTKVLISGFYKCAEVEFRERILKALEKEKLEWEWLEISSQEAAENIAYINFLQTKDIILVPAIGKPEKDLKALNKVNEFFPDYMMNGKTASVNISEATKKGGALNCISWTK